MTNTAAAAAGTMVTDPVCGMTLAAEEDANPELGGMTRRFWISAALTLPLLAFMAADIRQNLFFAFAYNALGVPVAAGVLYPFLGLRLSPRIASAAMTLSSVSVILNALRLRRLPL
jgi:P-type Cu+ transporter